MTSYGISSCLIENCIQNPTRKARIQCALYAKFWYKNTIWVTHWGERLRVRSENSYSTAMYKIDINFIKQNYNKMLELKTAGR